MASNCTSQASPSTIDVTTGSQMNLTVYNIDTVVTQNVSGVASGSIPPNTRTGPSNSETFNLVVNSTETITFTPVPNSYSDPVSVNYCPIGSTPVPSTLTINAVAAPAPTPKPTPSTGSATTTPAPTTTTTTQSPSSPKLTAVEVAGKSVNINSSIVVKQSQSITVSGQATPSSLVTLTIHSTPRIVSVTADKNGNWSYTISGLAPGNHTIQASSTDIATKQASPTTTILSFKVLANPTVAIVVVKKHHNYLPYIILGIIILAALAVLAFFMIKKNKNKKPKTSAKPYTAPKEGTADLSDEDQPSVVKVEEDLPDKTDKS